MEQTVVIDMIQRLVWTTLLLSAPLLVITMVVGLVISILQAVTQIQESSLSFVPKLIVALVVTVISAPWMIGTMVDYTGSVFGQLPAIAKMH